MAKEANVEEGQKTARRFLYFLVGASLGSLIAFLFAPQSGRDTRDSVARKAEEAKEYARRKALGIQDRAERLVEQGRETIREKTEQVNAAVDAGRAAYRQEIAKGKATGID